MFSDMKFFANPRKFLQAGCRPARNVNAEWQNKSRRLGALSFFKQGPYSKQWRCRESAFLCFGNLVTVRKESLWYNEFIKPGRS